MDWGIINIEKNRTANYQISLRKDILLGDYRFYLYLSLKYINLRITFPFIYIILIVIILA